MTLRQRPSSNDYWLCVAIRRDRELELAGKLDRELELGSWLAGKLELGKSWSWMVSWPVDEPGGALSLAG